MDNDNQQTPYPAVSPRITETSQPQPQQPYAHPPQLPDQPAQPKADPQESLKQLQQTANDSHDVLAHASAVFPFNIFPDKVTLDREKLTITRRVFFGAGETESIRIEDILNVTLDHGPLFANLKISSRYFDDVHKPFVIRYLHLHEAEEIKHLIQGYLIALKKRIDCSAMPTPELRNLLIQLGQTQE